MQRELAINIPVLLLFQIGVMEEWLLSVQLPSLLEIQFTALIHNNNTKKTIIRNPTRKHFGDYGKEKKKSFLEDGVAICHGHDWLGVRGGRQDKNTRLSCLTFCNSQMRVIRLWFSHLDGNWNQNTQSYLFLREESNVILWFFQNLNLCWLYCFSWHLSCLPFRQKSHLALRSSRLTQQMLMLSMTVTKYKLSKIVLDKKAQRKLF